jgi:hypothetical protein
MVVEAAVARRSEARDAPSIAASSSRPTLVDDDAIVYKCCKINTVWATLDFVDTRE